LGEFFSLILQEGVLTPKTPPLHMALILIPITFSKKFNIPELQENAKNAKKLYFLPTQNVAGVGGRSITEIPSAGLYAKNIRIQKLIIIPIKMLNSANYFVDRY